MMNLLNPNRRWLISLVFFISMSFLGRLAGSGAEEMPTELSNNQVIIRLFRIKNLGIEEAKEKIKGLLSKDKQIGASVEVFTILRPTGEVSFLVVKDTPPKIQEIAFVIEELEKEFAPITVDLDFSDVPLGQILTTFAHIADLNIVGGEALLEKTSVHLKGVPIEDVFDIILKSTPYTYIKDGRILRIIPKAEMPLVTEVFELRFVPAGQVREAASHLITTKGNLKSFSKFSEGRYANFLIVTDTKESLEVIRELIKKLDKKLRQVMIEAKFCDVTLSKDSELGIEWVIKASLTGSKATTTFPFRKRGDRLLMRPAVLPKTGSTITAGAISFSDFTATLHALDTKSKVNLIANPQVATRDGEEAEIVIGERIPIPIYERNKETGTMEITGYESEEVGVLLRVTPIINNDKTVTVRIHPEVSEITDWTGPNDERPVVSTRQVSTVFTVEDGKTIVLAGLRKHNITNELKQVPGLGKIPLLGQIFRYQDKSSERRELLIFITPHILEEIGYKEEAASDK